MRLEYEIFDFINWTSEKRIREIPDDQLFVHNPFAQKILKEANMAKKPPKKPKPRPGC